MSIGSSLCACLARASSIATTGTWRSNSRSKESSKIRLHGCISLDLSKDKEVFRVPVHNKVDQERSLLEFEYIAHPEFSLMSPYIARPLVLGLPLWVWHIWVQLWLS
ncbi:hypothetical protein BRADI_1g12701v3 [Brachypodium distachyon]|uniref:Uncharacterized protein n=1 Tax=Brachypodium distachyon TaxID=15368 RepID=A0A0Q3GU37_BRADI|nr:hypothetical protein BRADI_1g12701v3 [Brachypodium distachyon]